jgi:hypothetical protein
MYCDLKQNVMQLFTEQFKWGDRVIVVHSDCKLYFGRFLGFNEREIVVGSKRYSWDDIVLIAHDGFPCKEFHMSLSLEQFDEVDNWESVLELYKAMGVPLEGLDESKSFQSQARQLKRVVMDEKMRVGKEIAKGMADRMLQKEEVERRARNHTRVSHVGFGCPFEIVGVQASLLNPFNGLTDDFEETLYMKSDDGAVGMLWNLEGELLEVNV